MHSSWLPQKGHGHGMPPHLQTSPQTPIRKGRRTAPVPHRINRNILECKYRKALSSEITSAADHSGVRYSKEDIKRRKVERKFDKRSIKKNWRLQTPEVYMGAGTNVVNIAST